MARYNRNIKWPQAKTCILAVAFLLAMTQFIGGASKPVNSRKRSDAAKSDYIFMEALRYEADDSTDAYFDMICRAYQLNPDDKYLGYDYGLYQYLIFQNDSSRLAREGLDLMRRYVVANPSDNTSGMRLAAAYANEGMNVEAIDIFRRLYGASDDPRVTGSAYATALAYTFDNDSIRKALTVLDDIEKYTGIDETTIAQRTRYYSILGDTAAIIREIRRYVVDNPRSVERMLVMADIYARLGDADSAMIFYNKAVEADPSSGVALYSRAQGYMIIGDTASSVREISQAMKYPDLDADTKIQILQSFIANEDGDSTVMSDSLVSDLLVDLAAQYPYNDRVRTLFGSYLYTKGDKAGAAEQFSYALEQNPDSPEMWQTLASIYFVMDDYDNAASTIEKASGYFPDNSSIFLQGSSIEVARKRYDSANKMLDKAMAVVDTTDHSAVSQIYGLYGDVAFQSKNADKAWDCYRKALELDPYNSVLLNNVAYYMACENVDLDQAQLKVERALELEKMQTGVSSDNTLDTYAWVLFKRKDYVRALEVINEVLESEDEVSADVLEHAGDIYFMNGHPDEALEFWTKALELNPDNELLQRKVSNKTFFFE